MSIIDCDVHPYVNSLKDLLPYMPRAWQQVFSDQNMQLSGRSADRYPHPSGALRKDAIGPQGGLPASDPRFTIEDLLDPYDIELAMLQPVQVSAIAVWTDAKRAAVFASAANDYFLEHWVGIDSRYGLCITVSPHDGEMAAEEIRRHANEPGVVGIQLPLTITMMGNRHYHAIYEAAEEQGLPVLVHPTGAEGSYTGMPTLGGGVPRTYAERHALLPQVAQANLASLIFEGVFDRYPGLRVMFVEYGFSWLAAFMWRLDKEWRNFRADVPWIERPPSEYVREFVRFSTQPIDEPAHHRDLWALLGLLHADEVLVFSSDYPHYDNDSPQKVATSLLPKELRGPIMYDNAKALFEARSTRLASAAA
jgi:predicted TIM-barrel fold metal-dependent hydrolase